MIILCHIPLTTEDDQYYLDTTPAAASHVGVTLKTRYNEWHQDHYQELIGGTA